MNHLRFGSFAPRALVVTCVAALAMSGCGGGGGGPAGTSATAGTSNNMPPPPPPPPQNVVAVVVDSGPTGASGIVNTPYISVTVCVHGTSTCQTIDHVSVDTGSTGLRIISSVLTPAMASALPQAQDAQGRPLVECIRFADGFSWGPVTAADVQIGGEQVANLPMQVIGSASFSAVPSGCSSAGSEEDTVATFGANAILGIEVFRQDCGSRCVTTAVPGMYYACPASGCTPTTVPLAAQVSNPVYLFPIDNNGTILDLPAVGASGAAQLTGSLIFGIDTQSNNMLGTATILAVDPGTGNLTATLNGQSLPDSFLDSGSNAYFFPDGTTPVCSSKVASGFYCPTGTQSLTATLTSATGIVSDISFLVANADTLFAAEPTFNAFSNLGAPSSQPHSLDLGLPYFMGRRIYTAIENSSTSGGTGPFVAF